VSVTTVYIVNEEPWALAAAAKVSREVYPSSQTVAIHAEAEPLAFGWADTLRNLAVRVEKAGRYLEEESSAVAVSFQAGVAFLPAIPRPAIVVSSAVCSSPGKLALGYSVGPPLEFLAKNESLPQQVARFIAKLPAASDPLDELLLEATKGFLSARELAESSLKNAFISLRVERYMPYLTIERLKEYVESTFPS